MSQADLPTGPLRPTIATKEQTQFRYYMKDMKAYLGHKAGT